MSVTTAMLCKEQGITVTGICAVYELFVVQKVRTPFYCMHTIFHVFLFSFFPAGRAGGGGRSQNSELSNVPQIRKQKADQRMKTKKIALYFFFLLFCLQNNNIQISVRSMAHLLRCILNGKRFTLSSGAWTTESKKRLIVLFLTTIGLLFARFKVMGSQLPVFTR